MTKANRASKNVSGAGSIRKKTIIKNGKEYTYWEARYTAGFDPGTGKQLQRSITGKTQKEVAEKLRKVTVEIDNGTYIAPNKMTLNEWLDIWSTEYLVNIKPHTKKSYEGVIKNHIRPALGTVKLIALTPLQVQKLINGLKSTKQTALGEVVSPKTAKNVHGVLHSALNQAMLCGYINSNPAERTVLPKRTKAEIHVMNDKQILSFFKAIEGHRFENLYLVDLFTGMRQSELLGLQWSDVDFKRKILTIKRQLQYLGRSHGGYQYATPKSNKPRGIVLPDRALEALANQQSLQRQMALDAGEAWSNPDNLVFTDELGAHIKHDVIYRNLKRIFKEMGIPNLRFHDLRHSYAVLSLRSGCDIKTVQENLGHYAAAFTLDTYGHVTEDMRREGADRMNRFLQDMESGTSADK